MRSYFLGLLVGLILLSGCATTRQGIELPDIGGWEQRNTILSSLKEWEFVGRIAVKADNEGFNGKFNWVQQDDAFDATVGGPLGIGTVRIEGEGNEVTLTDKDGDQTVLHDVERELVYRYGWTIPVASLRYWALGIPDPSTPADTEIDDDGRLMRMQQGDWTVDIGRYREGGGQLMPRILSATNDKTRVRLVIDKWLFFDR
ncbi:MAG: lipoprotein insertase outer membrane protein LolB [Woeseiaceae bacterium]